MVLASVSRAKSQSASTIRCRLTAAPSARTRRWRSSNSFGVSAMVRPARLTTHRLPFLVPLVLTTFLAMSMAVVLARVANGHRRTDPRR